ncbi:restriction endonuclease subunit S [Streptococcus thermophilus]|uniref:restriction endonuclease subunit S n=1 Tax=Streptococcus thermophilus TaxID=1308 RepID=UPI001E4EE56E|nr:restriction endonuclease subunit S [Streptococcus thermophilus]MCD9220431.1 restriction endonuclease subunit S [Streptococcus thermophilus]MCE2226078.1 restriction endonuclease subunit S [Streptococcus thermophilus]MCE2228996.1 restriction endonuclease subunit S [Streptococcus thermophilus]MCE2233715.1 restriction endonuclease subunit S [Streptococcus thermophilus]MCE2255353.1 restriction endonuclease subunit S [Streptococcus thermophilus]
MTRMKESGVDWIGQIPEEWGVSKIKFTTQLNGRIGWQGLTSAEYKEEGPYLITGTDFHNGTINFETAVHIDEKRWSEASQIQVENGDLLITKDGTVGKVAIISGLDDKASLNSGVLRIQTIDEIDRKFLYYVLLSDEFWMWFNYTNSGASTILHLYQNVFDEFTFTFPQKNEQTKISDFLDKKTAQLDKAKALLEEQIQKLKDYRSSLIYETVTKGLDKTVPMKDSGIDWIGQVPEGWGVKRLKDYVDFQTGTTPPNSIGVNQEGKGIRWFKPGDFSDESIDLTSAENYITSEIVNQKKLSVYPEKTILVVGVASIGKVGYSENSSYSNQQITALKVIGQIFPKYLAYFMFSSGQYIRETALYTVVPIINNQYLSSLKIVLPNLEEQESIVEYLDRQIMQINKMITIKNQQIENINKQRQTLIYDYVTGKRRV